MKKAVKQIHKEAKALQTYGPEIYEWAILASGAWVMTQTKRKV